MSQELLNAALSYRHAGLSVVPASVKKKFPTLASWKTFQGVHPPEEYIQQWFSEGLSDGVAILAGAISGHLEMIDFDFQAKWFKPWAKRIKARQPNLLDRLVIEETQSGGLHVVYRCPGIEISGNRKLAAERHEVADEDVCIDPQGRAGAVIHGKSVELKRDPETGRYFAKLTYIETRGEGGLFLCSPSTGYKLRRGALDVIPEITPEEREILIEEALALSTWIDPQKVKGATPAFRHQGDSTPPGEDFNRRANAGVVGEILSRHGWTPTGDGLHWTRPGKGCGVSGTVFDNGVFYNFSSSTADFDSETAYSPFAVKAILDHHGDFSAAARELARAGFGDRPAKGKKRNKAKAEMNADIVLGNSSPLDSSSSDGPCAADLAEAFLAHKGYGEGLDCHLRYWRGEFWTWTGRHYEEVPRYALDADVTRYLQSRGEVRQRISRALVTNVVVNLTGLCSIPDDAEPPCMLAGEVPELATTRLAMTNGVLDIETVLAGKAEVVSHTPRFFTLASLPFAFASNATCPRWLAFLEQAIPDEDVRELLQQWFGYNLVFDIAQHKFVLMHGEGANGKSVACCVLKSLLGPSGFSAVGLEAFSPTRTFPLAAMVGKLANIAEEIGEVDKTAEGVVKSLVAGNEQTIERKFRDPFNMKPTARLTFSTNVLPRFTDRSDGIWRRMLLVPFTVQVAEEDQDKRLVTSEYWEQSGELPGIFNWAIEGLCRLRERGYFIEPRACRNAKIQFRHDANPALSFLNECCESDPQGMVPSGELYHAYRSYVEGLGQHPLAAPQFTKEVQRVFPGASLSKSAIRLEDGKRGRVWRGIATQADTGIPLPTTFSDTASAIVTDEWQTRTAQDDGGSATALFDEEEFTM